MCVPESNDADTWLQRPCSTQDTGTAAWSGHDEDGRVQDAVLLAPISSSPSYRITRSPALLGDELRHAAGLARLDDAEPARERLVERDVPRDRVVAREEGGDDDPAVLNRVTKLEEVLDHVQLLSFPGSHAAVRAVLCRSDPAACVPEEPAGCPGRPRKIAACPI